jgi:hypothetical protein
VWDGTVEPLAEEERYSGGADEAWEPDDLLELISHDLINQQQAALGFMELLEGAPGLSDGERVLVDRTVEALEQTARLILQVKASLVQREWGDYRPTRVSLDRALTASCRTVQGVFASDRLSVQARGLGSGLEVLADGMLTEMLTQIMLLLVEPAPPGRPCRLTVDVRPSRESITMMFQSEGFALPPMVTDALTGGRGPQGRTRDAATVALVRQMLVRYGGRARMEKAPPGGVGAHLVIEMPSGGVADAVDNDSG